MTYQEQLGFLYCNCAECGTLLLGYRHTSWYSGLSDAAKANTPKPVCCRVNGRPYCSYCMNRKPKTCKARRKLAGEPNPWCENAVRAYEDRYDSLEEVP
jgi:hypothetical protein